MDISSLGAMGGFIQNLPSITFWAQIVIYIVLILFFGSIAVRGYRGYLRGILRLALRIGSGFACLLAGMGLSSMLPGVSGNFLLMITQLDMIIGGIISSIVLLACFYIITFRFPRTLVVKNRIKKLQKRLERTKDRTPSEKRIDPLIIIGVVIIAVFLIFSLMNFRGFPSMTDELFSQMGISQEEFSRMGDLLGGEGSGGEPEGGEPEGLLPEGMKVEGGKPLTEQSEACMSAMLSLSTIRSQLEDPEFLMSHAYSSNVIKDMIESGSGKTVVQMFKVSEGGRETVIAVTEDMFTCIATPTELCTCVGTGS